MLRHAAALVAAIAGLVLASPARSQPDPPQEVFTPYALPSLSASSNTVLSRLRTEHAAADIKVVRLNVQALTGARANSPRTLSLGDARFDSVTRQTTPLADGRVLWKGEIASPNAALPAGDATLVIQGQSATGTVSAPDGRRYQIRPLGGDATAVIQLDFNRLRNEEPPGRPGIAAPPGAAANAAPPPVTDLADAVPTIDLLVVYTPGAQARSGGIDPLIDLATVETNDSFINSRVTARTRVVARMLLNLSEEGKSYDQIMAEFVINASVTARRDAARADVVVLIMNQADWCGQANDIKATADKAFALVHYGCATGYYSFGHELGHLIGARHDVAMDPDASPYPYGHGYGYPANVGAFRTVMGYACDGTPCNPRVPYWSNPSVLYNGRPTGNATTAYNARVWNERAAEVAAFR